MQGSLLLDRSRLSQSHPANNACGPTFLLRQETLQIQSMLGRLQERKLVHELAEHYGLTTQSLGQEPQRHIELFKTPRSSIPGRQESRRIS